MIVSSSKQHSTTAREPRGQGPEGINHRGGGRGLHGLEFQGQGVEGAYRLRGTGHFIVGQGKNIHRDKIPHDDGEDENRPAGAAVTCRFQIPS